MISLVVDAVLLTALAVTTFTMLAVRRRLRRLDVEHGALREVLADMTDALDATDATVTDLREEGCALLLALGTRIEEARRLTGELDRRAVSRRPMPEALGPPIEAVARRSVEA